MRSASALALAGSLALCGCGGMLDDLSPSGADRRPPVQAGSVGPAVGQQAPDFSLPDVATGAAVGLHDALSSSRGAVLYFTMWCPVCDAHMTHLQWNAIPAYPGVRFFALDYVSGSVAGARAAQQAAGWDPTDFTVLADVGAEVERFYSAPMQIVVVGADRVIRLNGEYDWAAVRAALESLP